MDPSAGMLEKAKASLVETSEPRTVGPKFTFVQGSAEDMRRAVPEDGSVDLLIAGTFQRHFLSFAHQQVIQPKLRTGLTGARCGQRLIVSLNKTGLLLFGFVSHRCASVGPLSIIGYLIMNPDLRGIPPHQIPIPQPPHHGICTRLRPSQQPRPILPAARTHNP